MASSVFLSFNDSNGHAYVWRVGAGASPWTFTQLWNADWTPGPWVYLPFASGDGSYFWTRDAGTGHAYIWQVAVSGDRATVTSCGSAQPDAGYSMFASLIVQVNGTATPSLLGYDPGTGKARIWAIHPGSATPLSRVSDATLVAGATLLTPVTVGSWVEGWDAQALALYVPPAGESSGVVSLYGFQGGTITAQPTQAGTAGEGAYTACMAMTVHGDQPWLFYYDGSYVLSPFGIDGAGEVFFAEGSVTPGDQTWVTSFMPFQIGDGASYFLAYSGRIGTTNIYELVDERTDATLVPSTGTWNPGFSSYVSLPLLA